MTQVITSTSLACPNRKTTHNGPDIKVGPDILELLSSAMYVDPITIYREYIQNAADAVDEARNSGVLTPDQPGRVDISIDAKTRSVCIRDNGSGVPAETFGRQLLALGGSEKRGTKARGFRGVGRLAGLGYAREMVFRTSTQGETITSELRWDCQTLRAELFDLHTADSVADLIRSVTSVKVHANADAEDHFFEVQLNGVVRLGKDRLTSPSAITAYLAQVAPVPFAPEFRFGAEIRTALSEYVDTGTLLIRINDTTSPIYRPHRNMMIWDGKRHVVFESLHVLELPGMDGDVAALAWILHHDYEGAIPEGALVKGLRLRSGDIQIGGHTLLENLFPETRFNAWTVGEVHVLDRRIVPNGRRDQFEQNIHYGNLLNHFLPTARAIAHRCRTNSRRRKWEREFDAHAKATKEKLAIIEQGGIGADERKRIALEVEKTLLKLTNMNQKTILKKSADTRTVLITSLRNNLSSLLNEEKIIASPLAKLSKRERQTYEHFFELVYLCSTNRVAAKTLIDRILMHID